MPKRLTPRQKAARMNRRKWRGHTPEGLDALREAAIKNRPWKGSTGPQTPEGKARVRLNALRHGGRAFAVLPDQVKAGLESLRAAEEDVRALEPSAIYEAFTYFLEVPTPQMQDRAAKLLSRYTGLMLGMAHDVEASLVEPVG